MNSDESDVEDPFGGGEPDWARDDDDYSVETREKFAQNCDENIAQATNGRTSLEANNGYFGAEHVLFLLDCHPSMFTPCVKIRRCNFVQREKKAGGESDAVGYNDQSSESEQFAHKLMAPMELAIAACHKLLRLRIRNVATSRTGKRDGVGILLFGCNTRRKTCREGMIDYDSDGDSQLPSTHELLPLAAPGVRQVLTLQKCLPPEELGRWDKASHMQRDLRQEFRGNEESKAEDASAFFLRSALHEANKIFMNSKCVQADTPSRQLPDHKSIWILTNQDDPCREDDIEKKQIAIAAKDIRDNGIDIHLLSLPTANNDGSCRYSFNKALFYDSILSPSNGLTNCFAEDNGIMDMDDMLDQFEQSVKRARKNFSLPMLLPGWKDRPNYPGIMLDLYSMVQVKRKPLPISVHQQTNRATVKKTQVIDSEKGTVVPKEQLFNYAEFCGQRVSITRPVVTEMKKLTNSNDSASLILIGFRPMHAFSQVAIVGKSYLAFPNNILIGGSNKSFHNLRESMLRKGVFAVGELLTRATSTSRLVAMLPQNGSHGGMVIRMLPFEDDVRLVQKNEIEFAERASVEAAKKLMSRCTLHNVQLGEHFENPVLKSFYDYLESVSFGRELVENTEDDSKMDKKHFLGAAKKEIESFHRSLPQDEVPEPGERKRRRPTRALPEDICGWIKKYKANSISECTATELKIFLRSTGERITGNKNDLINRVHRYLHRQMLEGNEAGA